MDLATEVKKKLNCQLSWSYLFYSIGAKGKLHVGDNITSVCYGPVGAGYKSYQDNRPKAKVGIVIANLAPELVKISERGGYRRGRCATKFNHILVDALTDPKYDGRFKSYVDDACAEFGLDLKGLNTFMKEVGLIVPTTHFSTKPKVEIMSLLMFFRESYAKTLSDERYDFMNELVEIKTLKDVLALKLMILNYDSTNRVRHVSAGGVFHGHQTLKEVMNFVYGTDPIETIQDPCTSESFGESFFWSNSNTYAFRYLANRKDGMMAADAGWRKILMPIEEFRCRNYAYTGGLHQEYWATLMKSDEEGLTEKQKEYRTQYRETLQGVFKKCVDSA